MTATAATSLDVDSVSARIEALLDALSSRDAESAALAEDAIRLLLELYGHALRHTTEVIRRRAGGADIVRELAEDDVVAGLLALHGVDPHQALATAIAHGSGTGTAQPVMIPVDSITVRRRQP